MHSLLEDSSVEWQCTTECITERYILHDVTHELVSQKIAEKCPQRRLSTSALTGDGFDAYHKNH